MAESITLAQLYKNLKLALRNYQTDTPELEARIMIEERAKLGWSDIVAYPDKVIASDIHAQILHDLDVRLQGRPLSRIYGIREFWGLPFVINDETLDPRPDTELIVELALQRLDKSTGGHILDLGTGSGCILISLLHEFQNMDGLGVDLSPKAIEAALQNAERNNCKNRARFICGSWFESVTGKFDLIVSNPPYIANHVIPTLSTDVREFDPILALDGGDDGLQPYKIIFSQIKNFLSPNGIALFEIGYDQKDDVTRLVEDSGLALRGVHIDWAGNPRVVEISCGDK